jgi:ABC-type Fe3+-hydroxamate transport system substrate-binding protein
MKTKLSGLIIVAALLLAACSSATPAAQASVTEATQPVSEAVPATEASGMTGATEAATAVTDTTATVSFSKDVWPIIEKYALAAHGGKGGVYLENYDQIMKYVTPGDPENSMLYKSLIGKGAPQMPPDGPPPDNLIQTIYDWIKQGALNN